MWKVILCSGADVCARWLWIDIALILLPYTSIDILLQKQQILILKNLLVYIKCKDSFITLIKLQKLCVHDFVTISAIYLLLFVNTSPYTNDRAVL
jgi:hypothetical protein